VLALNLLACTPQCAGEKALALVLCKAANPLPGVSEHDSFLGAFAELRKAAASFVMSVGMEQIGCELIHILEI
jgi:hypothetical protein